MENQLEKQKQVKSEPVFCVKSDKFIDPFSEETKFRQQLLSASWLAYLASLKSRWTI